MAASAPPGAPPRLATTTGSSVSEVLRWWQSDAEEILYNLGFVGGDPPGVASRVPPRFFSRPLPRRGIDFQLFLRSQVRRMETEDPCLLLASRFQQLQALAATADAFFCLYSHVSRTPPAAHRPPGPIATWPAPPPGPIATWPAPPPGPYRDTPGTAPRPYRDMPPPPRGAVQAGGVLAVPPHDPPGGGRGHPSGVPPGPPHTPPSAPGVLGGPGGGSGGAGGGLRGGVGGTGTRGGSPGGVGGTGTRGGSPGGGRRPGTRFQPWGSPRVPVRAVRTPRGAAGGGGGCPRGPPPWGQRGDTRRGPLPTGGGAGTPPGPGEQRGGARGTPGRAPPRAGVTLSPTRGRAACPGCPLGG
ncbi:protein TESPA1 [Pseudopipra pipra]|uniref:protein TESPA1 n=1 Tax=Pseudopipra pipra TaxID=415032 RepID=UPI0031386217